jgi:predicted nucleic acid-binding protein
MGLLLLAKEKGILKRVSPLIEDLQHAGLYLAPSLITKVLGLAREG